ncbi:MAG: hypothetical protein ACRC6K_07610, partial [Fusobacteriaceae bacterium]
MTSITDKELLTFCNLAKLKTEYADLIKERKEEIIYSNQGIFIDKKEILTYHTTYTLIETEIESQKKRKKMIEELKITDKEIRLKQLYGNRNAVVRNVTDDYEMIDLVIHIKEDRKKLVVEGQHIHKINKFGEVVLYYKTSDDIRRAIPIVMEYYDRYPSNKESEFLNQWELLYSGDSYEINKSLTVEFIENSRLTEARKKKLIETIPTREELEEKKDGEKFVAIVLTVSEHLDNISGVLRLGVIDKLLEQLPLGKKKEMLKLFKDCLDDMGKGPSLKNSAEIMLKLEKDIENKNISKEVLNELLKNTEIKRLDTKDSSGVKIILLRKGAEYVIAIEDTEELEEVEKQLNDGLIPKEAWQLQKIVDCLIKKHCNGAYEKVTVTGFNSAGKLVALLGLINEKKINTKAFYIDEPLNLGTIVDFTEKDIASLIEGMSYLSNWELTKDIRGQLGLMVLRGAFLYATNGNPYTLSLKALIVIFGPMILSFFKETYNKNSLEKLVDIMIKENIIK